jgi:hypothetical protein
VIRMTRGDVAFAARTRVENSPEKHIRARTEQTADENRSTVHTCAFSAARLSNVASSVNWYRHRLPVAMGTIRRTRMRTAG